jgi:UDP-N-acetylmuramyl pentapeptide synthase
MTLTPAEIASYTGSAAVVPEYPVSQWSVDTRTLPAGALDIPIRGEHHDGHSFLRAAVERGVTAALGNGSATAVPEQPVSAWSIDTRTLPAGALYIPIRGENHDGHSVPQAAAERGATAALGDGSATVAPADPILQGSIDTHTLPAGALYIPIRGEHHDGHSVPQAAAERGATAALGDGSAAVAPEYPISRRRIDTRTLPAGALDIPIRGEHHDGHSFLQAAVERGATAALGDGLATVTPEYPISQRRIDTRRNQIIGDRTTGFSDSEVALRAIRARGGK